jgi:uncharacterized protein (TIGR02246 family)
MAGKTPQDAHRQWVTLFNAGDLDNLLELYEKDVVLFAQPGQQVSGIDAAREALQMFIDMGAQFTLQDATVGQSGDIALVMSPWTAKANGPEGPMDMAGTTSDVLVRGTDGGWRFKIDNPYGTGS